VAAYGAWGLFPLYFKTLGGASPLAVLAHRSLWSFVMLTILVGVLGRWSTLVRELRKPKLVGMLTVSTLVLGLNWLTFIYAVSVGQVLQSSLGYFINPLVNVVLGVAFLHERLRPWQIASLALAGVGVATMSVLVGAMPWIALALAMTFGLYGLMRKLMPVDGMLCLTVETTILAPAAAAYVIYTSILTVPASDGPSFFNLMLSGPVTTIPLLFFGGAARRLRLSTMGILQYMTPSFHFLLAVLVFGETFNAAQAVSFACIWTAILIYTLDSLRAVRQHRLAIVEPD
jgi:chloramphenicol-sensitive protein RarD